MFATFLNVPFSGDNSKMAASCTLPNPARRRIKKKACSAWSSDKNGPSRIVSTLVIMSRKSLGLGFTPSFTGLFNLSFGFISAPKLWLSFTELLLSTIHCSKNKTLHATSFKVARKVCNEIRDFKTSDSVSARLLTFAKPRLTRHKHRPLPKKPLFCLRWTNGLLQRRKGKGKLASY